MKKLIILCLYCMISYNSSCKPDHCDDFEKCNGPQSSTQLTAYLSKSDSVLRLGDTLRFYIRVPDTLTITQGPNMNQKVLVKNLYNSHDNNYVRFFLNSGDSTIPATSHGLLFKGNPVNPALGLSHIAVKHGIGHLEVPRYLKFRPDTRDIECYFIFSKVGRYIIMPSCNAITLIDKDDKRMFLTGHIVFADAKTKRAIPDRFAQYLKHMPAAYHSEAKQNYVDNFTGVNWYYFEVKE